MPFTYPNCFYLRWYWCLRMLASKMPLEMMWSRHQHQRTVANFAQCSIRSMFYFEKWHEVNCLLNSWELYIFIYYMISVADHWDAPLRYKYKYNNRLFLLYFRQKCTNRLKLIFRMITTHW